MCTGSTPRHCRPFSLLLYEFLMAQYLLRFLSYHRRRPPVVDLRHVLLRGTVVLCPFSSSQKTDTDCHNPSNQSSGSSEPVDRPDLVPTLELRIEAVLCDGAAAFPLCLSQMHLLGKYSKMDECAVNDIDSLVSRQPYILIKL